MTIDLVILRELLLPLLTQIAHLSPAQVEDIDRDTVLWMRYNDALLDTHGQWSDILIAYNIPEHQQYEEQFESLKAEYFVCLAQLHCAGLTNPTIVLLLERGDLNFIEEVNFQQQLLAAVTQAGRAALREDLKLWDEFAGEDISDSEISTAFATMDRDARHSELRQELERPYEEEIAVPKPAKKKRLATIPLLLLRSVAAAAVGTMVIVGVVKVYNSKSRSASHVAEHSRPQLDSVQAHITPIDSARYADTPQQNRAVAPIKNDSAKISTAQPYIILKGVAADTAAKERLTDVTITMEDDKGKKQSIFSEDGDFTFKLPLHRNFVISGQKEGYHSARLSLSTMEAQESDAGDVIDVVLRFSKDQ